VNSIQGIIQHWSRALYALQEEKMQKGKMQKGRVTSAQATCMCSAGESPGKQWDNSRMHTRDENSQQHLHFCAGGLRVWN
jgi:hypothetical protein